MPGDTIAVLIPALNPPPSIVTLLHTLLADPRVVQAVVVDDGSGREHESTFAALEGLPRVDVIRHPENRGKGEALKTGFRHIAERRCDIAAVVTADADGQHLPADILRVGEASIASPGTLVIGARAMIGSAPLRSRFGNGVTRALYHGLVGHRLSDTQSGLRAIPRDLLEPLADIAGCGYEYELNMLIWCRQAHVVVVEQPIETVYLDGNRSSHFHPIRDSLRIYSVLLKFSAASLSAAVVDNVAFALALWAGLGRPTALVAGRLVSAGFNYPVVRRLVFPQWGDAASVWRYLTLVVLNLLLSGTLGAVLAVWTGLSAGAAKAAIETLLFLPNFLLQRDVVFRGPTHRVATLRDRAEPARGPLPAAA